MPRRDRAALRRLDTPSGQADLLALPADRRSIVDADTFPGRSAYDTHIHVFGQRRRVVLTHSQTLHDTQARGFEQTLAKSTRNSPSWPRPSP